MLNRIFLDWERSCYNVVNWTISAEKCRLKIDAGPFKAIDNRTFDQVVIDLMSGTITFWDKSENLGKFELGIYVRE